MSRSSAVVITGMGMILPGCDSREQFWCQIREADSQLTFDPDGLPVGRVRDFDPSRYLGEFPASLYTRHSRDIQLLLSSLVSARKDAGLDLKKIAADRIGLFAGTSRGNFAFWYEHIRREPAAAIEHYTQGQLLIGMPGVGVGVAAAMLGVRGPTYTFNNSCASGSVAIGHALRELRLGEIDVAFAAGHEAVLCAPIMQMYKSANLLSSEREDARRAVRPYMNGSGNAFGEGGLTLVLERREDAEQRGATIIAELAGYAYANGGEHPTHVDRTGTVPAQLVHRVLHQAAQPLGAVGFVVGHGNGCEQSDRSELAYMDRLFSDRVAEVPLLSTKPIYGHTLGVSSTMNVAAAALMVHHGVLVPAIGAPGDAGRCRPARLEAGLAISYGIGGNNTATLVRKA